jgi:hypothetical protein
MLSEQNWTVPDEIFSACSPWKQDQSAPILRQAPAGAGEWVAPLHFYTFLLRDQEWTPFANNAGSAILMFDDFVLGHFCDTEERPRSLA